MIPNTNYLEILFVNLKRSVCINFFAPFTYLVLDLHKVDLSGYGYTFLYKAKIEMLDNVLTIEISGKTPREKEFKYQIITKRVDTLDDEGYKIGYIVYSKNILNPDSAVLEAQAELRKACWDKFRDNE